MVCVSKGNAKYFLEQKKICVCEMFHELVMMVHEQNMFPIPREPDVFNVAIYTWPAEYFYKG